MEACYVSPSEPDLNKADTWTFHIPSDLVHGLTFPEDFQLSMEIALTASVQNYKDDTYAEKVGAMVKEPLDPIEHCFKIPESIGGLIFFKSVEIFFRDLSYPVNSNHLNSQSVNWLNNIASLEASMIPDSNKEKAKRALGFGSAFHEMENMNPNVGEGKMVVRASIPSWPMRQYSPYSKTKKPNYSCIPHNVNMCVKLLKEKDIPLINILQLIGDSNVKTAACLNTVSDINMKNIIIMKNNKEVNARVEKVNWTVSNVYLHYKKVKIPPKISKDFLQTYSAYRVILSALNSNSHQEVVLQWDVLKPPKSCIIYFLRDLDLQWREGANTSVCPARSYRPTSLAKMTFRKSTNQGPVDFLELAGLDSRSPHPSWYNYLEYLNTHNFCSQYVDFWNIPARIPSIESDRGSFNAFPVDLTGMTTGSKESLQLILEFSSPPEARWTVGVLYQHDCQAKFAMTNNMRSFESTYV